VAVLAAIFNCSCKNITREKDKQARNNPPTPTRLYAHK